MKWILLFGLRKVYDVAFVLKSMGLLALGLSSAVLLWPCLQSGFLLQSREQKKEEGWRPAAGTPPEAIVSVGFITRPAPETRMQGASPVPEEGLLECTEPAGEVAASERKGSGSA